MATFTLTLTDDDCGSVTMTAEYGEAVDPSSKAHAMGNELQKAILQSARAFEEIEDTAPDTNVEPARVITTDTMNEGTNHGI